MADKRDVVGALREAVAKPETLISGLSGKSYVSVVLTLDDARKLLAMVGVGEDCAMSDYACAASADGLCELAREWRAAKEGR